MTMTTNVSIRSYVKEDRSGNESNDGAWLSKGEIPSSVEINGLGAHDVMEESIQVPINDVAGPWSSKEKYLADHYTLLREDAISPLRDAVCDLRHEPNSMEKDSLENANIYEKVHITGFTFATSGIAARITFSLRRAGKRVLWEQSKRLVSGSMVALTPAKDMFKSICRVAVVAARPLEGLQQNPPEIDIFFATPMELEMDPQQEWVMVESKNGYFEAYRHTLRSLQKMATETFPLSEHVVHLEQDIQPPKYLDEQPYKDLSLLYPEDTRSYHNVDVIQDWPQAEPPVLDASQFEALRRILTKRLAIIQGPPGTGKTHVSVAALELLLHNWTPGDPPIILAAHTNHAVDQLLRHVSRFEPEFIRLGGRTTDYDTIKPRTLFEVRLAARSANPSSAPKLPSLARMKAITKEMKILLAPLTDPKQPITSEVFLKYRVITEIQYNSLKKGAAEWVRADDTVRGDIAMWLGRDLVNADARTLPEDFGFDFEEVDLEFEQLKEMEAEAKLDDEAMETLRGERISLPEPFTGRKSRGVSEEVAKAALRKDNLWEIEESRRGPVYRIMQRQLKDEMRKHFRQAAKSYHDCVLDARVGRWEADAKFLKDVRVIGMTTTGLSKYRGLIQNLQPRIVLIEEAAETLEAYVTVACFQSLHHLILVGDHQQLRGHCNVQELEVHPFYLAVSMFERLVKNHVGFSKMIKQRRMVPEIRRALKPIYEELEDHESVLNRPPIAGMGDVNTYFFSHQWRESTDDHMSKVNEEEAAMIVGFFDYLVHNGIDTQKITVLTFYNGQRKMLLKELRTHPNLQGCIFKVVTVDSYQGEENDIVILSLVRNNSLNNIGFLDSENRVCVALSRAQRGFYIFGNAEMLSHVNALWWAVVQIMGELPCRVGFKLPLTCTNHGNTIHVEDGLKFLEITGGCDVSCEEKLPCGHDCALKCHPFAHNLINCKKPCKKVRECGHDCEELCYLPCRCACTKERGRVTTRGTSPVKLLRSSQAPLQRRPQNTADFSESQPFRDYAEGGHVESDAKLAAQVAVEFSRIHLNSEKGQQVELVRTSSNARGVWKGVYGNIGDEGISADPRDETWESTKPFSAAIEPNGESSKPKEHTVGESRAQDTMEASTVEETIGESKGKEKASATKGSKNLSGTATRRLKKKLLKKSQNSLLD